MVHFFIYVYNIANPRGFLKKTVDNVLLAAVSLTVKGGNLVMVVTHHGYEGRQGWYCITNMIIVVIGTEDLRHDRQAGFARVAGLR